MAELMRGPLRALNFTTGSGAGGDTTATLRPPVGEVWDVYIAIGGHDGAAGLTCAWYHLDTIGPITTNCGGGAAQPRKFYADAGSPLVPLRINHESYLAFQVLAIAAAKTVGVTGIVERIVGADIQGA
jgi:hypothetical protein